MHALMHSHNHMHRRILQSKHKCISFTLCHCSGQIVMDIPDGFDAATVQAMALESIDPQTRQAMVWEPPLSICVLCSFFPSGRPASPFCCVVFFLPSLSLTLYSSLYLFLTFFMSKSISAYRFLPTHSSSSLSQRVLIWCMYVSLCD